MSVVCRLSSIVCCLFLVGCATNLPLEEISFFPTETPPPTLAPTAAPVVTSTPDPYSISGLRTFMTEAAAARLADRQGLVNRYMALMPPAPLTADREAAVVYQGPGNQVALVGDLNNWDPPTPLERLPDTDLWVLFLELEPAARLDYLLVVDGREQLDPRNPLTEVHPRGPRSKLVMPGYLPEEALPAAAEAGDLVQQIVDSAILEQRRTVFVYTPAGATPAGGYPVIYFLDGTDYINLLDTPDLLDRLIAAERILPAMAVFVPPIDRLTEYNLDDEFARFLADELVPLIQRRYPAARTPAETILVGRDSGGAAAVHAALVRPDIFGRVISQSGFFTLQNEQILRQISLREAVPIELYLTIGTYETAVAGHPADGNLIAVHRKLAGLLGDEGYRFTLDERPEGHSWGLWRSRLGPALENFLNPQTSGFRQQDRLGKTHYPSGGPSVV